MASNLSEKVAPAGRPIWRTKIRIPTTRHIRENAKERKGRKENRNSSIPMMETRVIHHMTAAKENADMTKENPKRSQPRRPSLGVWLRRSRGPSWAEEQSADCTVHRAYLCRLDRPRLGSIMELDQAGTHPMKHPALMAFRDAFQQHEKEAIHEKLIQDDSFRTQSVRHKAKPFGNKADGASHQP